MALPELLLLLLSTWLGTFNDLQLAIAGCRDPDTLDRELEKLKQKNLLGNGTYEILQVNLKVCRTLVQSAELIF